MRFQSIASRIITIFLSLILVVQLSSFFIIRASINDNAINLTTSELGSARQVLSLLLDQNFQKLQQSTRLLKSDESLIGAVATGEQKAIARALAVNAPRVGSDLIVWINAGRDRVIATQALSATFERTIKAHLAKVDRGDTPVGIGVYKGRVYQFVLEPISASAQSGWVAIAAPIDERVVSDLHRLTDVDVSVMIVDDANTSVTSLSSLQVAIAQAAEVQLRNVAKQRDLGGETKLRVRGEDYNVSVVPLDAGDQRAAVVLLRSISDATEPFQKLQLILLTLTGLSIVIAFIGSASAVRRITDPLLHLANSAERLGQGDYSESIPVRGGNEVADLSRAIETMRVGIAKREHEISRLAYWDPLTDLPNRAQFTKLLGDEISSSQKDYRPFCLLMMDLDRFKHVNDIMGHSFGDALLRQAAERITMQIKEGHGHVARLGGDEFAVLLLQCTVEESRRVADRILAGLEVPIAIDDQTVDLGASIGIVAFPDHGLDAETLLSHAELAMYEAKRGGNAAVVFDPALDNASQESLSMLSDLRRAIDDKEFELYIQPKINLATGEAIGGEALVRWVHPDKGIVMPDQFIPFAEKTGFVRVLTQWVLEQAASLAREMQQADISGKKISVNISARDLLDFDLPIRFSRLLAKYGVPASSFCLEITESSIMDDPARSMLTLESLHGMGADLSIDDFGTGYSSLSYLKRLPVDELKIDKNFVLNMENDADDAVIVRSTIDLGHNMGLRVVAEGVETAQAWRMLASMGCDQGQGYHMSKAMPASEFAIWLKQWSSVSRLPPVKEAGAGGRT
jgi:diguanylate cyclase (GGDEF)-like protein